MDLGFSWVEVIADLEQSCVREVLGRGDWFEGGQEQMAGSSWEAVRENDLSRSFAVNGEQRSRGGS